MPTAYYSNGAILESPNMQTLYKAVMSDRRFGYSIPEEITGVIIRESVPGSREIYRLPQGRDVPLVDAEPSVRVYNILRRKAQWLGLPYDDKSLTVGVIRQMMLEGYLVNLRNAGTKSYKEIFSILYKYTGWNSEMEWHRKVILDTHWASFRR